MLGFLGARFFFTNHHYQTNKKNTTTKNRQGWKPQRLVVINLTNGEVRAVKGEDDVASDGHVLPVYGTCEIAKQSAILTFETHVFYRIFLKKAIRKTSQHSSICAPWLTTCKHHVVGFHP